MISCTRCDGTGFLNTHQININVFDLEDFYRFVLDWIERNPDSDVQVCDCCGDGKSWYGIPG